MRRKLFTLIVLAATLCACNKEQMIESETPTPGVTPQKELVFTATMEGAPETRASYDGTYKCASWEVDDRISINGFEFRANTAGTSTTFSKVESAAPPMEMRPEFVSSTNTGSYQNQPAQNLVDAKGVDSRWIADKSQRVAGAWNIVVSTGTPFQLKTIKLWNAANQDYPSRRWKMMKLYGSTSLDDEWEEISDPAPLTSSHPFDNLKLEINNQGLAGEIAVNSTKAYTFYRIDVLDNEGDNYMQMSDMKFVVTEPETLEPPYTAYFPADLYQQEHLVLPSRITETWADGKFNMPMYAQSNTTDINFKNLCGVLKITVKNDQIAAVKNIRVSSKDKALSGNFIVDADNAAVLTNPDKPDNTVTVIYTDAVTTTAEGKVFYLPIPAQTYHELKIEISASGAIYNAIMTTKSETDITVARNTIYPITFVNNSAPVLPEGALPGRFRVRYNKTVYFSKGNLQAKFDGKKYIWGFAENQYDYIGSNAGNTTIDNQSKGKVVDLFGWSTSNSSNNYGINTETSGSPYYGEFVDWGRNMGIDNTWYTLSAVEWHYLLDYRTVNGGKGAGKSYSPNITYGGNMGLVIYPDDYIGSPLSGTVTTLPEGVVFLPAAGTRYGSDVNSSGSHGLYWSSAMRTEDHVYMIEFYSNVVNTDFYFMHISSGNSVRLVIDAE